MSEPKSSGPNTGAAIVCAVLVGVATWPWLGNFWAGVAGSAAGLLVAVLSATTSRSE